MEASRWRQACAGERRRRETMETDAFSLGRLGEAFGAQEGPRERGDCSHRGGKFGQQRDEGVKD